MVDTTVLVYAVGTDHPLKQPSERLLGAVAAGAVEATTTAEVIQEFATVRSRRRPRKDAVAIARGFAELLSPLLTIGRSDLEGGLTLFERHERLGSFDAILAAAAMNAEAASLVTADVNFREVRGLPYVGLDSLELERLLAL